ncbi:hypothetical protein ADK70_04865 [Streptomyces rimosus subsp. pseudoverticillatus]|uniref:DUF6924 domain-containing protein n=1 Tax=Streptomyces rimosus TaxID=1927 RepID=UPI0006B276B2|nr:hypothetical protein [Streptomyces rimosus]KOT99129.1 hypothetical protein ADK70_04865 [Streptomyces rimosus subsp. pseudoverticillatus]
MKSLPRTEATPLVRTDFSDQAAWQALRTAVTTPDDDDCLADVHIVDDRAYSELTTEQVISLAPAKSLLIVADKAALSTPEMPLLVVLVTKKGHSELRVIAAELASIENNISIANMDWEEFTEAADDDGVFRGF